MILLHQGGTRGLRSVEYKSKNQMGFQQHMKESLDLPGLKNLLQQKGIPETLKLGNKNNNQVINALLKVHSPKDLITLLMLKLTPLSNLRPSNRHPIQISTTLLGFKY